jgi:hypothetical protein
MNPLHLIAAISLLAGIAMILFSRRIGTVFCALGRFVFFIFKPIPWFWSLVTEVYDPAKAPKRFKILGAVFVAQAAVLVLLAFLLPQ